MKRHLMLTLLFAAAITLPVAVQEKGGQDETGPYDVVENWFKPVHEGWLNYVTGVFAESPNRIFVVSAGETPVSPPSRPRESVLPPPPVFNRSLPGAKGTFIVVVDRNGKKIDEWTQWSNLLVYAHKVRIDPYDPEKHVWVIDRDGEQILKFTNDGKQLVMTVGEKGVAGSDDKHFNYPADMSFLPDGSFFVADGYRNTRVVKFDKNGKFLMTFGTKGTGPGQFNLVHGVASDTNGRVYVADRNNNRVQIFDQTGRYLDQWPTRGPSHLLMTQDQFLWVATATNRLASLDFHGPELP